MNNFNKPIVVAIASVSGGGKTTLATHLASKTKSSKALFFDDYELEGPDDVLDWVNRGAGYDEWQLTPLVADIEEMLLEPLDYIFLDFPFAYQHSQMSKRIDFAVFIETPLDIALARRMKRDFTGSSANEMLVYLEHYITHGRRAYMEMLKTIKPDSDLIIDGTLPIDAIANQILEKGARRL